MSPIDTPRNAARRVWTHRGACLAFLALCLGAGSIPDMAPAHTGSAYIGLHLALTVAMLIAWTTTDQTTARWTLVVAVAARLVLLATPMFSSNDADRYLWDGAVTLAGLDPYAVAPDDPRAAALRAIWATPPEHGAYTTLYPPGALALFALSALGGPETGVWLWKGLATAAGIAVVFVSDRLLVRRGLRRHLPLLALSPLLVLETGIGAHVDAFVALALACALLAFDARRPGLVGLALGLGVTIKLLPGFALLALAVAVSRREAVRMMIVAGGVVGAAYGIALALGLRPPGSLPVFFEKWRNGSPLFTGLETILSGPLLPATLIGLALILLTVTVWISWRKPMAGVQIALAAPLLVSPVAFPWYLSALIPAFAVSPSAVVLCWVTAVPLAYEVRDRFAVDGTWMLAAWPLWAIGLAWAVGLAIDGWRARRAINSAG